MEAWIVTIGGPAGAFCHVLICFYKQGMPPASVAVPYQPSRSILALAAERLPAYSIKYIETITRPQRGLLFLMLISPSSFPPFPPFLAFRTPRIILAVLIESK